MCGHLFIGYPGLQTHRQHQPLWRCSACGRQSHMPLDCCANPDYQTSQSTSVVVMSLRRLRELIKDMKMRLPLWLKRNPEPRVESGVDKIDTFAMTHSLDEGLFVRDEEYARLASANAVTHVLSARVSESEDVSTGCDGLEGSPGHVRELQVH